MRATKRPDGIVGVFRTAANTPYRAKDLPRISQVLPNGYRIVMYELESESHLRKSGGKVDATQRKTRILEHDHSVPIGALHELRRVAVAKSIIFQLFY